MVRALLFLAAIGLLAGCAGGGEAKLTGDRSDGHATLTLANQNESPAELQPWLAAVRSLSKGRVRIRVRSNWRRGEPDAEAGVIADVRSGRADLGWVGARAWSAEGVRSLDALAAPFLVNTYAAEESVLESVEARRMLDGVAAAGVEPVGLLPGPLRLLIARRPVRRVSDLQGLRIGVTPSVVGERALRKLGAVPLPLARGASLGDLDAVEGRMGNLAGSYVNRAPYLTADAPVWPTVLVLFANRRAWARLDRHQRVALLEAAGHAAAATLRGAEDDDSAAIPQLCDNGVRVVTVGPDGRAALRAEVASLYDELAADSAARPGLQAAERARTAGDTPARLACVVPSPAAEPALTGTFEWTLRRGEAHAPFPGFTMEGARYVRYRLVLEGGRAIQTAVFPDGHSEPGFDEKYTVYRDRIELGGDHGPPLTARWRLQADQLKFSEMNGGPDDHFVWESHPWIRVRR